MDQRFSRVPWIDTALDLEEGRRFLWQIDYQRDVDRAMCLGIRHPFQHVPEMYLVIHAVRGDGTDGGEIGLAISQTPQYDVYAREVFTINQSNPKRRASDDDGA